MKTLKHGTIGLLVVILFPIWMPLAFLYALGVLCVCLGEDIAGWRQ